MLRSTSPEWQILMAGRWRAKLSRPIIMWDGTRLETLREAGQFVLALPKGDQQRNSWQRVTKLLIEAAESNCNLEAVTEAIERASSLQFLADK